MMNGQPFIPAKTRLPEITLRVIIISILLTIVLATANAYLALRVGLLTSASIPAAIISMGILRFFKNSNVLENNLVQTAASAGEAVAGGIVYTIPAMVIIHYWHHFNYWENVAIAMLGGLLGVMFSVPIRRILVSDPSLPFPEGQAIAEVLHMGAEHDMGFKEILLGGSLGALIEFLQSGFKILASSAQTWFHTRFVLVGFGLGFSPTMIGAGYIMGFSVAGSIFFGAVIGWLICVPVISYVYGVPDIQNVSHAVIALWNEKIRYIGIGAMLVAGLWTLISLLKPMLQSIRRSLGVTAKQRAQGPDYHLPRTDFDFPLPYVLLGIIILSVGLGWLYHFSFPVVDFGFGNESMLMAIVASVMYVLIIGFFSAAVCGYFSGLVGVTATPGSAILITSLLLAAILIRSALKFHHIQLSGDVLMAASAIAIMIGSTIMGAAAIANDNIQDLKVGYLLGATPWKQQCMLMLGVIVSALVIPPVMQLLFNVYGIADVLPHAGMDPTQALPAPPAALMAAITQAIFNNELPWNMVLVGVAIISVFIIINSITKKKLSVLGIAIGMYLPLTSSMPLFIGGVIAYWVNKQLQKQSFSEAERKQQQRLGIVTACGIVAGAALMDVLLAIPFAIIGNPDALRIMPQTWLGASEVLSVIVVFGLALWFRRVTCKT